MKLSAKNYAKALFETILANPQKLPEIAKNFYAYLLRNKQQKMLPLILKNLEEIERERMGFIKINIETARPLSEILKKEIEQVFSKKVIFNEEINPKLEGGIILKWGDNIFDASILGMLAKMKEQL